MKFRPAHWPPPDMPKAQQQHQHSHGMPCSPWQPLAMPTMMAITCQCHVTYHVNSTWRIQFGMPTVPSRCAMTSRQEQCMSSLLSTVVQVSRSHCKPLQFPSFFFLIATTPHGYCNTCQPLPHHCPCHIWQGWCSTMMMTTHNNGYMTTPWQWRMMDNDVKTMMTDNKKTIKIDNNKDGWVLPSDTEQRVILMCIYSSRMSPAFHLLYFLRYWFWAFLWILVWLLIAEHHCPCIEYLKYHWYPWFPQYDLD